LADLGVLYKSTTTEKNWKKKKKKKIPLTILVRTGTEKVKNPIFSPFPSSEKKVTTHNIKAEKH
jgi:hypothetical protein